MNTEATPNRPYSGLVCRVAIQCNCPNTAETGSFLFSGETHRNKNSRVTPVFNSVLELFAWIKDKGFTQVGAGLDVAYIFNLKNY